MTDYVSNQGGANPAASYAAHQGPIDNTLQLIVGGQSWTGWQAIKVSRSLERVPGSFDIAMTDKYPGKPMVICKPGDTCQIKLGSDVVITGYIDRYVASIAPQSHTVRVTGRSKVQDLVDCSAGINLQGQSNGMQVSVSSLMELATKFANPFGITASIVGGDDVALTAPFGGPITFNITLTETPMEIIEEVARYARVLVYDDVNGNLLFADVGAVTMASGFQQGRNVQAAEATFSMDQRYSLYQPTLMSADNLSDLNGGRFPFPALKDPGVPRFRPLIVVSEQTIFGIQLAQQRAQWELNRRQGRSQMVTLTCDSWRDSAGTLWQPNGMAPVDIPILGIDSQNWIIADVSFLRDGERGTVAELVLMPALAFSIEPSDLQPYDWMVTEALRNANNPADPNFNPRAGDAAGP